MVPPGKAYTSFFYADILKLETSELYQIAKPIAASIVNTQIRGQNLPEKLIKSAETLAYTAYHSEDYVLKYRALNEENSNTWNKIRSLKKDDKNYDRDYQELRKISDAQNEKIFDLGEDEYLFVVKLPDAATFLQESLESGSMLKTDQTLAGKPVYVVPTEVNTHKGYVNKQLFLYSTNNNILLLSSKPEMLNAHAGFRPGQCSASSPFGRLQKHLFQS